MQSDFFFKRQKRAMRAGNKIVFFVEVGTEAVYKSLHMDMESFRHGGVTLIRILRGSGLYRGYVLDGSVMQPWYRLERGEMEPSRTMDSCFPFQIRPFIFNTSVKDTRRILHGSLTQPWHILDVSLTYP